MLHVFSSLKIDVSRQGTKPVAMSEEPPRKKRKQTMNHTPDLERGKDSVKYAKRVEKASHPTQMPQVQTSFYSTPLNFQKKYYRQRAHTNVLSDHALE